MDSSIKLFSSPLEAVETGSDEMVDLYLRDADVTFRNRRLQNAAHLAVFFGRYTLLPILIKHGVDMNCHDIKGLTPFDYALYAAEPKDDRIMHYLYENGFYDRESDSLTKSYVSEHVLSSDKTFHFVAERFNISKVDQLGETALHVAMGSFYTNHLRRLLFYHPELYIKDRQGKYPIDIGNSDRIRILQEYEDNYYPVKEIGD